MYSFNQLSACVKIMPVMDSHRSLKAICHFHFFFFVMLISSEIIFTSRKDIVSDDWCRWHLFENVNFFLSFDRYSFDYGSIHFTMMSTEHNFTQGSRQYKWIEQDLKNVNRSLTPWLAIVGHRAMYSSQKEEGKWDKKN